MSIKGRHSRHKTAGGRTPGSGSHDVFARRSRHSGDWPKRGWKLPENRKAWLTKRMQ